ncbi:hypothetical protein K4F52_008648 [Lecanicillium sp. MT-2017a]|nr:hypothetical protein K4F52_008648 [Lecanicillium sp. MT-2017a]
MSASLIRLSKALHIIKQIKFRLRENKFTEELRQSYMIDMNTISENLDLKQSDALRQTYKELFKEARGLHGQCTILDHKYEVAGVALEIDWSEVWKTLTYRLPEQLEPQLLNAIETEKSRQDKTA